MTRGASGPGSGRQTLAGRVLSSRPATALLAVIPVPLLLARGVLLRDNTKENRLGSWQRLRSDTEAVRYQAVRAVVERFAGDGFVLDLGCSQGILQEGLRYGRYVGVDNFAPSIQLARAKADATTAFVVAEADAYVADARPDAIVLNEVVYYLRRPVRVIQHHAARLADDGVIVLSIYDRSWSSRRLLRTLSRRLALVERTAVSAGHLSWTIAVYRPAARS